MLSLRSARFLSQKTAVLSSAMAHSCRLASTMVVSDPLVNNYETPAGTLAAVSAAQKLHDGPISLLVVSEEAPTKIPAGISHVLHVPCNDKLSETVASAIWKSQQDKNFTHIVMSSSKFGSTVVPRAGALLNVAPVTDVLEIVPPGNIYIIKLYATHTHSHSLNHSLTHIHVRYICETNVCG
jgi:electron transfer flavoprotein alpha subunit